MFRVYMVKDKLFYIQCYSEDDIILVRYPPVDIPDKDAYAHAVIMELNRQHGKTRDSAEIADRIITGCGDCPKCGAGLESGYRDAGKFRKADFVPQQYGAAWRCAECDIVWW